MTKASSIQRTMDLYKRQVEKVNGITLTLKSYLQDLEAVLVVYEYQDWMSKNVPPT